MGRLDDDLLGRAEDFAANGLEICDALQRGGRPGWFIDQLGRSACSAAANCYEADQAMSRPDFCRCLGVSIKELNETRFWLRLAGRRGWVGADGRTLAQEADELGRIFGSMRSRTRAADAKGATRTPARDPRP